jgi:hypothetical protein
MPPSPPRSSLSAAAPATAPAQQQQQQQQQPEIDAGALNNTLGRILGQLDLVTKTIISLEHRLTISENRTAALLEGSSATGAADAIIDAGSFDDEDDA